MVGVDFIGIRDGLFNEEIFNDLDNMLKKNDGIELWVKVRSNLEIVLKNLLASHKIVWLAEKSNSYVRPREIARGIWNKKLWRLLNEAYAAEIINNEQFKALDEIKKKCDNIIHNASRIILTEDGQKKMHSEIKPLFKHLLDMNDRLRNRWKTIEKR